MKVRLLIFSMTLFLCNTSYANWFKDIVDHIDLQGNITNGWLSNINAQQSELLASQKDIEYLMKVVNGSVTGNSGWGAYNFRDYQSYGNDANNWSNVIRMITNGGGSGALGQAVSHIKDQFPINYDAFSKGVSNIETQQYYAAQSQTVLAARAASQLDYDKIQDQIVYQQMLQQQIEKTNNLKAAVDLNNRIQVESNLINLEILRQTSISNQQQAMSQQSGLIYALSNAKFLTKQ